MSRVRFGLLVVLGLVRAVARPGGADEPKAGGPKRLIYLTRSLRQPIWQGAQCAFKQEVEAVAAADKTSNAILLTVSSNAYDELVKTLETIDTRPASIEVEVIVAELRSDGKEGPPKIDEAELSGPTEKVATKLQAMKKAGLVSTLRQFKLSALENQRATTRIGESRPFVIGSTAGFGGGRTSSKQYRDVGTTLGIKSRSRPATSWSRSNWRTRACRPSRVRRWAPTTTASPSRRRRLTHGRLQTTVQRSAGASVLVKAARPRRRVSLGPWSSSPPATSTP
jgi:hypothetical protein